MLKLLCRRGTLKLLSYFEDRIICQKGGIHTELSKVMKTIGEYGSWKSGITGDVVVSGNCKTICELQISGDTVFWLEQQFVGGRKSVFQCVDGKTIEWTLPDVSVRNSVHEYGGGSFIAIDNRIYFVTPEGVFSQDKPKAEPKCITKASKFCRYADLCYSNGNIYVVKEDHPDNPSEKVENLLAKIDNNGCVVTLASGADFYACPRASPNGRYLAWIEWKMPYMPWDDTTVRVAELDSEGNVSGILMTMAEKNVNFHGLQWGAFSELYVISDKTGWWNVYEVDISSCVLKRNLYCIENEIGSPPWVFGDRQFAVNKEGALLNVFGKLILVGRDSASNEVLIKDFENFSHLAITDNNIAFCIGSGPSRSSSVLKIDLAKKKTVVIRESRDAEEIDQFDISLPERITFSSDGVSVPGWFYPPFSRIAEAPKNSLPPVVIIGHGGPTANSSNELSLKVQYFTSRGFAVFDVNYRGSTGYGTKYRNLLKHNWGIVDRNDMVNAAKYLIEQGLVHPKKVCIMGSSAGGFLLLSALMHSNIFAASASLYGVSDLIGLYKDTHKFEQGYNEQLIGKYPEKKDIYKQRSPLLKAEQLNCPIAFFHGSEDTVVPLSQSVTLYEIVKSKKLPTALVVFPGEGHGFRDSVAIKNSIDGVYYFFCRVLGIVPSVDTQIPIENLPEKYD